ncbi:MAG: formylmethanofuran dehydrogenase [Candidatus Methanoperedens sp.]|nr:formylmethanofuran dehydrogenase [Candidatus Methanoperedens sp.]MCE8428100.1 formylmethanofuran dehydrogenase [Candidatus Methanoperedens sp.]
MKVLLNSGSTINEGRLAKGGDKLSPEYQKECAVAVIHPRIFKELGSPHRVKIISNDGTREVVVTAKCEDSVTEEQIFMPRSIWPNVVVEPETFSTGSPLYKGSPVFIEATEEEVKSAEDIVLKVYAGRR